MPQFLNYTTIISFLASWFLVWWVIFLAALPIGVRPTEQIGKGHDAGAPENPNLKAKIIGTTLVSLGITAVIYYILPYIKIE